MDFFSSKFIKSGPAGSKLSMHELESSGKNFSKLVQFVREMYEERLKNLERGLNECRDWESIDPALKAMKDFYLTEKFVGARGDEIFKLCVSRECEKTVDMLQVELTKKQAEVFRLEEKLFSVKIGAREVDDTGYRGKESAGKSYLKEGFGEMWENEKRVNEKLRTELGVKSKELKKTEEICEEYQKLMRYCEQLESERDLYTIRTQDKYRSGLEAGHGENFEVKGLRKKVQDQQDIIENLQMEIGQFKESELKKGEDFVTIREKELIEKQKIQIKALQEKYEKIMNEKLEDIQKDFNPGLKVVSEEKFYEVCRQKINLETQLAASKSQGHLLTESKMGLSNSGKQIKEHYFASEEESQRKYQNLSNELEREKKSHRESKEKLAKYEKKYSELEVAYKSQEERVKKAQDIARFQEFATQSTESKRNFIVFKLKKIRDSLFLLKSYLSSLKLQFTHSLSSIQSDFKSNLAKILSLAPKNLHNPELTSLKSENKALLTQLRLNSEAFDRLQSEVKTQSSTWKHKYAEKISKTLKDVNKKHENDLASLRSECIQLKSQLDMSSSTISINSHLIHQLQTENNSLRTDREEIKKKQALLEEKIQIQNNNFKFQLKNKQLELDLLKKPN